MSLIQACLLETESSGIHTSFVFCLPILPSLNTTTFKSSPLRRSLQDKFFLNGFFICKGLSSRASSSPHISQLEMNLTCGFLRGGVILNLCFSAYGSILSGDTDFFLSHFPTCIRSVTSLNSFFCSYSAQFYSSSTASTPSIIFQLLERDSDSFASSPSIYCLSPPAYCLSATSSSNSGDSSSTHSTICLAMNWVKPYFFISSFGLIWLSRRPVRGVD